VVLKLSIELQKSGYGALMVGRDFIVQHPALDDNGKEEAFTPEVCKIKNQSAMSSPELYPVGPKWGWIITSRPPKGAKIIREEE